jgi:hypothetical protein
MGTHELKMKNESRDNVQRAKNKHGEETLNYSKWRQPCTRICS